MGLEKESRKFTSFSALGKKYHFKKLPQGLCNSPSFFSLVITRIMGDALKNSCMMFLDDIVSFGDSLEHQIENLRTVFSKLRKGNMKLNIK